MKKSIQEVKLYDHTCLIFNSQIELFHCAIPFIREGLKKNEKCLIIIDDISREEVLRNFKFLFIEGKNPFEELLDNGRIVIENFKNVYLSDGKFDIWKTKENYLNCASKVILEGFSGLRAFVEVSNSMKHLINEDNFLRWELFINPHFKDYNFLAVCAYNKKYFSDDYISKVKNAHSVEIDLIGTRF